MTCPLQLAGKRASVSSNSRTNFPTACVSNLFSASLAALLCRRRDFRQILQRATELSAQDLRLLLPRSLEYLPMKTVFSCAQASAGPRARPINIALGADVESPAGFAYHTGKAVISNHLHEKRGFARLSS